MLTRFNNEIHISFPDKQLDATATLYDGNVYKIGELVPTSIIEYVNVSAVCQSKGGFLVVVDSIEKEALIENLIRNHAQTGASYLIGLLFHSKSSSYYGIAINNT